MKGCVLAGLTGLLLTAGCAPIQYTKADIDGRVVCDMDAVDRIERQAKRSFTSLTWINCPTVTLRVI